MNDTINFNIENKHIYYIDVRSESEYDQGHIVGAYNLPILNDAERHEVGTLYKQVSPQEAKRLGLKVAASKMVLYFDHIEKLRAMDADAQIVLYCARGGYRSRSVTAVLQSIGENVFRLEGGYKQYRHRVLEFLNNADNLPKFIMLHGYTGVGKTAILQGLEKSGYPVLDLEGAANHKGSHLGAIGTDGIQRPQMFENLVYHRLATLKSEWCFVESESKRIGNVFVPSILFEQMRTGEHVLIHRQMPNRISALMAEYCRADNFDVLIRPAFERIKPYLTNQVYGELSDLLDAKAYEAFTEIILESHYDPVYFKSIKNYTYDYECHAESDDEGVDALSVWFDTERHI